MAQAHSALRPSDPSVEQVADAINAMIAERADARLRKAPQQAPEPSLKPREAGVYFNLPAADYHADPSLGSSDLKRLLQAGGRFTTWLKAHDRSVGCDPLGGRTRCTAEAFPCRKW